MLELLYASGLRVSEIAQLPRERVDLDARILRVTGKGGKERLVPFGKSAAVLDLAVPGSGAPVVRPARRARALSVGPGPPLTRQRFWQLIEEVRPTGRAARAADAAQPCGTPSRRTCSSTGRTCGPSR